MSECMGCDALFSMKHILIDCPDLQAIRSKYFDVNIKVIFEIIRPDIIIIFMIEVGIYNKL